jgi:hypothetical protein
MITLKKNRHRQTPLNSQKGTGLQIGLSLLGGVLCVLLLSGYCVHNLHHFAYYYATHMPHGKNEYPFIRELDVRKIPESVNKDFPNAHNLDERKGGGIDTGGLFQANDSWSVDENFLTYFPNYKKNSDQAIIYTITSNYSLSKPSYYHLTPSPKDYQRTVGVLKKLEKRLKNESPKPIINLQWLYNLCYQNKRSEAY